jgi:predicted Zn-dependent peptidase
VSAYQASSQLASIFEISVTLRKGKTPAEALKIIDQELARLRKEPPREDELERARTGILSSMIFAMERVGTRANALNDYNQHTGDPGYFTKDVLRFEVVKAADVQKAAATYLPETRRIVTIVTPNKDAPRAGRLVGSN